MLHQISEILRKATMIWRSGILVSLLVGSLCIQFTFVKSGSPSSRGPGGGRKPPSGPDKKRGNDSENLDFIVEAFSNILLGNLENNDVLTGLFKNRIDKDLSAFIAGAIVESLVLEVGLADSYSSINIMIDALANVNSKAGPEAYFIALVNAIAKILSSNGILNFDNYFNLSNTVNRIVLDVASDILNELKRGNKVRKGSPINIDATVGNDIGINAAAGLGINSNVDLDAATNVGIGLGAGVGLDANANLNANAGINPALGVGANVGLPPGTNLNPADTGVNIDLKLSQEANLIFKSELTNALLKDKNFRYVFSDYVPSNALKQIAAAICQYISKAFAISRSFLFPLEYSIGNLSLDSTPCPEQYANIITGMLTNLFSQAKFITKSTASLQAIIASNAVTSGIASFISISTIPDGRLRINDNAFNSYFSILSGLEKLSYVGVEAASSKLPLSIKLTYASMNAAQFAKVLFSNLASSNKFLEIFSLGVPAFNSKIIAKSLGTFVAEAFGSPNSNLFYDLYSKALLTPTIRLNSVNYAKMLSSVTAKALYLSGYFLSGNINIQAAIAKNAIIKALISKLRPVSTQVVLFPNILGLSWITQLDGTSPIQILLKYGADVGLNVVANPGIVQTPDKGTNAQLNSLLGAGMNTNTVLGTGININSGLGADLGVNVGLGGGLGTNIGLDGGLGANVGLGSTLGANVGLGSTLGANIGLGGGLDVNAALGNGLNANVDLGGANVGLGTGLVTNSGLGVGLGTNIGLGGNIASNIGLGTDLNANVGLGGTLGTTNGFGVGLGGNIGLGGGLNANIGSTAGFGANAGLGAGLDANVGLGGVSNIGLGTGLGINGGLVGGTGLNTGLGTATGINTNLGSNYGINSGLGVGLGATGGLGTNFGLGANTNLGGLVYQGYGADATQGSFQNEEFRLSRNKRSVGVLNSALKAGVDANAALDVGLGADLGVDVGLGVELDTDIGLDANVGLGANVGLDANVGLGSVLGANIGLDTRLPIAAGVDLGLNSGTVLGVDTSINAANNQGTNVDVQSTNKGSSSNNQLTVLNVLPLILANKLYQSTALYTSISIVGVRKIIILISQAMASEFGLPIASVFLRSYNQFYANNSEKSFEVSVVGLAQATTEALAGTGFLNYRISVSAANQLADAIVSKFSSLIATSLETKDCGTTPQWTYILNQDSVQPPLIPGYNTYPNNPPNFPMK